MKAEHPFSSLNSSPNLSTSTSMIDSASPPSLIYSDVSDETEDSMNDLTQSNDISTVMAGVLKHTERVVEHLRSNDEQNAANSIAKNFLSIIETFNDATASWDIEKFLMKPPPPRQVNNSSLPGAVQVSTAPTSTSTSWAAVAATATADGNQLIKFRPSDGIKRRVNEFEPRPNPKDLRVIWIQNWGKNRPLSDVTQRMVHGPLYSMAYVEEHNSVCIIFQHSESAQAVLAEDQFWLQQHNTPLFGGSCTVLLGNPYPEDEGIRRMSLPLNERRRLTFARSQLFSNGMSENVFRKELVKLVGEWNLELLWLFNTGNATAVFTSTTIARLIRDEYRTKSGQPGPFADIQVSFSHDPCERPMNLITQMPYTRGENRPRAYSRVSADARTVITSSSEEAYQEPLVKTRTKPHVDKDGWQTVSKKR